MAWAPPRQTREMEYGGGGPKRCAEEERWANRQFEDREREERWREDQYRDRPRRERDYPRGAEGDWKAEEAKRRATDQRGQFNAQIQGNRPTSDLRDRLNGGKTETSVCGRGDEHLDHNFQPTFEGGKRKQQGS